MFNFQKSTFTLISNITNISKYIYLDILWNLFQNWNFEIVLLDMHIFVWLHKISRAGYRYLDPFAPWSRWTPSLKKKDKIKYSYVLTKKIKSTHLSQLGNCENRKNVITKVSRLTRLFLPPMARVSRDEHRE